MKQCFCVIDVRACGKHRRNQLDIPIGYVKIPGKAKAAADICPSCGGTGYVVESGKVPPVAPTYSQTIRAPEVSPCNACNKPCKRMLVCPNCNRRGCDVCCPEWTGRFCPRCGPLFTEDPDVLAGPELPGKAQEHAD